MSYNVCDKLVVPGITPGLCIVVVKYRRPVSTPLLCAPGNVVWIDEIIIPEDCGCDVSWEQQIEFAQKCIAEAIKGSFPNGTPVIHVYASDCWKIQEADIYYQPNGLLSIVNCGSNCCYTEINTSVSPPVITNRNIIILDASKTCVALQPGVTYPPLGLCVSSCSLPSNKEKKQPEVSQK